MKNEEELESERGQEKLDWILLASKMGGAHNAKEYEQPLGIRFSPTAFKSEHKLADTLFLMQWDSFHISNLQK